MSNQKNSKDILFHKYNINYSTEIFVLMEPKLVSINYFMLHNLLPDVALLSIT